MELPRGGKAWFPASYVFTAAVSDVPGRGYEGTGRFCHAVNSGVAAGPTRLDAACRGLCELVERDALALWWYLRVARPVVDLSLFDDPWLSQGDYWFGCGNRNLRVFDITTIDELPAVVAVSFLRKSTMFGYDVVLSGGCSTSLRLACRRAVSENVQHVYASGGNFVYHSARFDETFAREWAAFDPNKEDWLVVGRPVEVSARYGVEKEVSGFAFYEVCLRAIKDLGMEWYVVDVSALDYGVAVMRSIVPDLLPLFPMLGSDRLYSGAKIAGWDVEELDESGINKIAYVF